MAKVGVLLISLIALISLMFNVKLLAEKQPPRFKVIEVLDGDTFKIDSEGGRRVRLLGINAPEPDKCLSQEAKSELEKLVLNKTVSLTDQFTDPHGRIMANVFVGSTYVNREMAASGFVRLDYATNPRREELKAVYRHDNRCLSPNPPSSPSSHIPCAVKGNFDTEKPYKTYFLPNCRNYSQVVIDLSTEDQWFCTEAEAKAAGFVKSSTCP